MARVKVMKRKELDKTLAELFEDFQHENRAKNLSKMTLLFYENNSNHFFRFMKEVGIEYVKEVNKKHLDKFIIWLKAKELKATTINIYLRATRTFLFFAMREKYLAQFDIKLIKVDKQQKEPYSEEEIKKLIKKPNIKKCGFVEHRNWVTVNYLLETGNRLNTVLNLKVGDIDFTNGMVILTKTKNRKAQYNPISEQLLKILSEYVKMFRLKYDDFLFVNEFGSQLTNSALQHTIARYNRNRGVEKTSIHAFRHTFAKHYIISGGDAFKLQRLLGHSTLDVTLNYVNLYSADLKEGFDKHSILANFSKKERMKRGKREL